MGGQGRITAATTGTTVLALALTGLAQEKAELMRKLGKKQLMLQLDLRLDAVPPALARYDLTLSPDGNELIYTYDSKGERSEITSLLADLDRAGIRFNDLNTRQSSLEDIFVGLVRPRS